LPAEGFGQGDKDLLIRVEIRALLGQQRQQLALLGPGEFCDVSDHGKG